MPCSRVTLARSGLDLAGVEQVDVASVGGNDNLTVDNLTGTDVTTVNNDLAATLGGSVPRGWSRADRTVNGTDGGDGIVVAGAAGSASVSGLSATVNVVHADRLVTSSASSRSAATTTSTRRR